jgi:hypothetical protein
MRIGDWRPRAVGGVAVLAATIMLTGCGTPLQPYIPTFVSPPHFDAGSLADMTTVQKDADTLFTALGVPGSCSYTANTAQFDLVDQDLASLLTQAGTVANNNFTTKSATLLQRGFDTFRGEAKTKDPACLPQIVVADKKSSFDNAVASLVSYENAKTKG